MKKGKTFVKFIFSSAGTTLVDFLVFTLLFSLLRERVTGTAELIATVVARIISSLLNFTANKHLVFQDKGSSAGAMLRYYCLAVPQMLASAGLVTLGNRLFDNTQTLTTTLIKAVVDSCLFVASFLIQRRWVFRQHRKETDAR